MPKLTSPIQESVQAKPHTPVYRMHRYFARRPYSVFAELVSHYSDPGDVILDPFCGGGVTLVEGTLQGRKVIGFDVNPLATFVTRMELANVNLEEFQEAVHTAWVEFEKTNNRLFSTICDKCGKKTPASWFEYSAIAHCNKCDNDFLIAEAEKSAIGTWNCTSCNQPMRFSPATTTQYVLINVCYSCTSCNHGEVRKANESDIKTYNSISSLLRNAEKNGLWIPNADIPDCNMQRESALFKKGITKFRQLFTNRHLLALAELREIILKQKSPYRDWLLFAFSSTLRYTNRMVTRNPNWRGDRPLEWAKPGYWLPPVHLEANVLTEFLRRCDAVYRGKKDHLKKFFNVFPCSKERAVDVILEQEPSYHVGTLSSTNMPLPNESIDVVITDPPYGGYVHYADLSNFWSVWLPEIDGLGAVIDTQEEAVIARKDFPGAKNAADYQGILEKTFNECSRVLKPGGYMVMTFHNREPKAWMALLLSITKAGFELPADGIIFQDGIPSYKHTAQSRRAGSVIGDFILSFRKVSQGIQAPVNTDEKFEDISEKDLVQIIEHILRKEGSLKPDVLLAQFYLEVQPRLLSSIRAAIAEGNGAAKRLIERFEEFQLFDSHRRQLLEQHFLYTNEKWSLKEGGI